MKLSFRALKRFVDFEGDADKAANLLADLGFPNDGMSHFAEALDQVVIAKIEAKEKHPEADRLSLLKVNTGSGVANIVCGAQNMKAGDYVALAPIGAKLPSVDGKAFEIKRSKIRGVESEGMCCSESELGLLEESEGIWILPADEIEKKPELLGRAVSDLFDWKDSIMEVDVTPNRGDALSVRGLARELAAKLGLKLKPQRVGRWKSPASDVHPSIESFQDASGFLACVIEGVKISPTPEVYRRFLTAMGARSISPLVDISNIVMFELGHPVHFFDADKVEAARIQVRRAKKGEKLELLDDSVIELHEEDLVIADSSGPLSLAGVMGGKPSSVTDQTTRVLLEVACFDAKRIRASSRRHQISSESSFRFERVLTPHALEEVVERVLGLIQEFGQFERASGTKVFDRAVVQKSCLWNRQKVEAKLGKLPFTDDEVFSRLRSLEYEFEGAGNSIKVVFPWYRTDAEQLEDAMEDVARLLGYENLESRPLVVSESVPVHSDLQKELKRGRVWTKSFCEQGFTECLHASFADEKLEAFLGLPESSAVSLMNPLHAEKSILRRSLLPQLLERAKKNASHGEENIQLMEEGPIFLQKSVGTSSAYSESPVTEAWRFACIWMPRPIDEKRLWKNPVDAFFEFKGKLESVFGGLKSSARPLAWPEAIYFPNRMIRFPFGLAGELHPRVLKAFDLSGRVFAGEWSLEVKDRPKAYGIPPEQPAVDLDLSLLVASHQPLEAILQSFEKNKSEMMEWVRASDLYEAKEWAGEKRAITFSFRYRSATRSLSMEEAQKDLQALAQRVMNSFPSGEVAAR
jgi:phenylalanyl-tRNA synthetase beta chain